MKKLYPLIFKPILKEKVWGEEARVIAALDEDSSEVVNGFLAENDLADLLETYMGDLVGDAVFNWYNLQFPLLVKLLNVEDYLSVQVHPDDETAFERFYSSGKTELWYVMEASPEAKVYLGFKKESDATEFYSACSNGTVTDLLNEFKPEPGDAFFIPAGTVHACGGGLILAEIQESSDLGFRLYDWGRRDPEGNRPVHLEEAIDCIDYHPYNQANIRRKSDGTATLAVCSHFVVRSIGVADTWKVRTGEYNSCVVYLCTDGEAIFQTDGQSWSIAKGESILIPASIDEILVSGKQQGTRLLEVYVPQPEEDADSYTEEK